MRLFRRRRKEIGMATDVPPAIADAISAIAEPSVTEGEQLRKLVARARMDPSAGPDELLAAQLAGIWMNPAARERIFRRFTELFRNQSNLNYPPGGGPPVGEVIIGGGFHGAGFANIRHLSGYPKPYVLETGTPGGAFAVTEQPSFWLNSEVTDGLPGPPWNGGPNALNWLPGAPVQAAQLTGRELVDNTVIRYIIQCSLMMHARVITRASVVDVRADAGSMRLDLMGGRVIRARRVIDARGIGPEKNAVLADGVTVLTWAQAMAQMDGDYPFAGMRRVAVIGKGKSVLCACEALLGIGPDGTMRAAADGMPSRVDLYAPGLPQTRQEWMSKMQTRYLRLGAHLPVVTEEDDGDTVEPNGFGLYRDLYVYNERGAVVKAPGGVIVNGRFYDHVILATGHREPVELLITGAGPMAWERVMVGGRAVALKAPGLSYFRIGPRADLPFEAVEYATQITTNPEQRVAMHRYAPLTAMLASTLPPVLRGQQGQA